MDDAIRPVSHCATGSATFPSRSVKFNRALITSSSFRHAIGNIINRHKGIQSGSKVLKKNSFARNPKMAMFIINTINCNRNNNSSYQEINSACVRACVCVRVCVYSYAVVYYIVLLFLKDFEGEQKVAFFHHHLKYSNTAR